MANLDLVIYNTKILNTQMQHRADVVLNGYNTYDIQTRLGLMQSLFGSAAEFYSSFGTSETARQAYDIFNGPPLAEDWNKLQRSIANDLTVLYDEQQVMYGAIQDAKNYNYVETAFLQQSVAKLKNQVAVFTAPAPSQPGKVSWYAGDDLHDTSRVDQGNTNATVLVGSVELARDGKVDYSDETAVAVNDRYVNMSSTTGIQSIFDRLFGASQPGYVGNGFVGNFWEAYLRPDKSGETAYSTSIALAGQQNGWKVELLNGDNLRNDVSSMVDGNPATWMEYSVWNFEDQYKQIAQGYGLDFVWTDPSGNPVKVPWYKFTDDQGRSLVESELLPNTVKIAQYNPSGVNFNQSKYYESVNYSSTPSSTTLQSTAAVTGAPQYGGTLRLVLNIVLLKDVGEVTDSITITPKVIAGCRPRAVVVEARGNQADQWVQAVPMNGRAARVFRKGWAGTDPRIISDLIDLADPTESFSAEGDDGANVWLLPKAMPVKAVRVILEQPQSYTTDIGHIVYGLKITTTTTTEHQPGWLSGVLGFDHAHSETSTSVEEIRIDGGNPSLEVVYANSAVVKQGGVWVAVGMAASLLVGGGAVAAGVGGIALGGAVASGTAALGAMGVSSAAASSMAAIGVAAAGALIIGAVISGFFGSDSSSVQRQTQVTGPFVERFPGWRYAIGVRDIALTATKYQLSSEFQSTTFLTAFDVKRITLTVSESIPGGLYASDFTRGTEWIEYSVSPDGGATWYPIAPKTHFNSKSPTVYYVNSPYDASGRSSKYGYIDTTSKDSYSVKFKAVLKRPPGNPTTSPRLHAYRIQMEGTA